MKGGSLITEERQGNTSVQMGCSSSSAAGMSSFTKARLLIMYEETVRTPNRKMNAKGGTTTHTKLDMYTLEGYVILL